MIIEMARVREVDDDTELEELAQRRSLANHVVQNLDLGRARIDWSAVDVAGAVFLGCTFPSDDVEAMLRSRGAFIFPAFEGLPYNPYRRALYSPAELMAGYERGGVRATVDYRIARHVAAHGAHEANVLEALAQRIHDHAIDDALGDFVGQTVAERLRKKIVGIMGGHRVPRDATAYRDVARLAWRLTHGGYLIATGGGPGMMEAAHLGAYLASRDAAAVIDEALAILVQTPNLDMDDPRYVGAALEVVRAFPDGAPSLGVPTWLYGNEPTNVFSTHIAKYFANSIREDGLLGIGLHGIVFATGGAGTTQEIFQDLAQNHYGTFGYRSPMVFLGNERYQRATPIYPLVQTLAAGQPYAPLIALADDPDEAAAFIEANAPIQVALDHRSPAQRPTTGL